MKTSLPLRLLPVAIMLLAVSLLPIRSFGQTTISNSLTISGNVVVTGTNSLSVGGLADFQYPWAYFGTNSGNINVPGFLINYTDSNSGALSTVIFGTSGTSGGNWQWEHLATLTTTSALVPQMTLSNSNILILWNPTNSTSTGITLNPSGTSTFANSIVSTGTNSRLPNQQNPPTDTASILTLNLGDGRYLQPINAASTYMPLHPTSLQSYYTMAIGSYSTALGFGTQAIGYGQLVVGQYNIAQGNPASWVSTDNLFVVGNGTSATSPSNAFVVKKNGDMAVSGNTTLSGQLNVNGNATFSNKIIAAGPVMLAAQGDLSMGNFTAGGNYPAAFLAANTYKNTLAASGVTLSDAEFSNIANFLSGLDSIVGLNNVVDCWSLRSTQNAGKATVVYGMLGKLNATVQGTAVWTASGIKIGNTVGGGYVQLPGGAPFLENNVVSVFNCYITHDINWYNSTYNTWDSVTLAGNEWYYPGRLSGYRWSDGVSIDCRMYGNTTGYWYEAGGVANDTQNFFSTSVYNNTNYNYSNGALKGTYAITPDTTQTQSNPNAYDMINGATGVPTAYAVSSFHMILTQSLTDAQHNQIYNLYKSTIGQGLNLP